MIFILYILTVVAGILAEIARGMGIPYQIFRIIVHFQLFSWLVW